MKRPWCGCVGHAIVLVVCFSSSLLLGLEAFVGIPSITIRTSDFPPATPFLTSSFKSQAQALLLQRSLQLLFAESEITAFQDSKKKKKKKSSKSNSNKKNSKKQQQLQDASANHQSKNRRDPLAVETWRVFGVQVHPNDYCTLDQNYGVTKESSNQTNPDKLFLTPPVIQALRHRLGIPSHQNKNNAPELIIKDIRVVRRSLDARKKRRHSHENDKEDGPRYVFVLDVDVTGQGAAEWT